MGPYNSTVPIAILHIIHSFQEFIKFVDPEEKPDPVDELFRKFDKGVFISIDNWE